MYTQCPDCSTAFRVTAEVLKQAAGRVRCGGCGVAFNALDFLSEQKPSMARATNAAASGKSSPSLEAGEAPTTISPQRSAALMETLDKLSGSDVRIEDTGVEWRVLGDADAGGSPTGDGGEVRTIEDTGSLRFFIADNDGAAAEEMRFDDNTPLPDDFDFDDKPAPAPPPPPERTIEPVDLEASHPELALGDPEEWQDLLGEVDGPPDGVPERRDSSGQSSAQRALAEELDELPDDDSPSGIDEQFAMQAEAMGIDISGIYTKARAEQAEAGDDESDIEDTSIDDDLIAAAFEAEQRVREEDAGDEGGSDADVIELELDDDEDEDSGEIELVAPDDDEGDDSAEIEFVAPDDDGDGDSAEIELAALDDADLADIELEADDMPDAEEPVIPPPTEEEQTINKMIDEELLAIAVEDDDGFASTIVQVQPIEEIKPREEVVTDESPADESAAGETAAAEAATDMSADNPLVETIIMEGEYIRDEAEERALEEARRKSGDPTLKTAKAAELRERIVEEATPERKPRNYRMIAGIALLALLLVVQVLHFSREALATNPVIRDLIAPIYRLFGQSVIPDWNVRAWRFEATRGSTADGDETLTIYSRIGNNSAEALPYPLISVSLTDRFEDVIGSEVLEPAQYLGKDADTRTLIAPESTFDAMITIEAPDAEAVGFKLNVCYTHAGKRLRCAIEDFK